MRNKRRQISGSRRPYQGSSRKTGQKEPDILVIWEQQRRMREREVQLEREYEAAKQNLKDVKRRMRQNDSLLADSALLHTSFKDNIVQLARGFWLWLKKTLRKSILKAEIFYIKTRLRLGIPLLGRTNFTREKVALAFVLIVGVAVLVILPGGKNQQGSHQTTVQGSSQSSAGEIPLDQSPEFPVLSPGGSGVSELGGYAKVSPPGAPATFAYLDSIENVGIKVSQQELPDKLKDRSELEKMAKDFNANRQLETDQGTIFIGQSAKGPQSLVFERDGLLVLISSEGEIPDSAWKNYLASLSI